MDSNVTLGMIKLPVVGIELSQKQFNLYANSSVKLYKITIFR